MVRHTPATLDSLQSRGKTTEKAASLGGLHAQRQATLSQFFTPDWLSRFIWQTVSPAFSEPLAYSLLDNSIGNAAMFRYADPNKTRLFGFDVDGWLIREVVNIFDDSGFIFDIEHAGMEHVELEQFSAAFINPPFSIPLASPFLKPYPGITHYGKFGPDTSALSHEYALAQALAYSDIVAAVVPQSVKETFASIPGYAERLRAIFTLPNDTFKDENVASVRTELLIFDRPSSQPGHSFPGQGKVWQGRIDATSVPPELSLSCRTIKALNGSRHPINVIGVESSQPAITTALTGDKMVILRKL